MPLKRNNIQINRDFPGFTINDKELSDNLDKLIVFLLKKTNCEITLLVTDDKVIQMYNQQTRGKNLPTDVLSFPMEWDINHPVISLGEIIISMETCLRQADELMVIPEEEFYRLLVHGLLHLLGYDHETGEEDARIMRLREDECLDVIFTK